jgi:hypothetical protein
MKYFTNAILFVDGQCLDNKQEKYHPTYYF